MVGFGHDNVPQRPCYAIEILLTRLEYYESQGRNDTTEYRVTQRLLERERARCETECPVGRALEATA